MYNIQKLIARKAMYMYELAHDEHQTMIAKLENGDFIAFCACGMEWTYPKDKDDEYIKSIWESHIAYFNRPKLVTL